MSSLIDERYHELGGPNGPLGQPKGPEQAVGSGRMRAYAKGSIFASEITGAQALRDSILRHYTDRGGPTGPLVFPTSESESAGSGSFATFQAGGIFSHRGGTFSVDGPLFLRYMHHDGPTGLLGFPTSDTKDTPGGRRNDFSKGAIYWSPATGAHELHGAILDRFRSLGGTRSFLGFPLNDESDVLAPVDTKQLQNGNGAGASVRGATRVLAPAGVAAALVPAGAAAGMTATATPIVGRPRRPGGSILGALTGLVPVQLPRFRVLGRYNRFTGGTVYWSSATGAWEVHGAIRELYESMGGPAGDLGFPTTNEEVHPSGVRYNNFQKGIIVWSGAWGGARAVMGIQLNIGRVSSSRIDDGWSFPGRRDKSAELVTYTTVHINGTAAEHRKRRPSGHAGTSFDINSRHTVPLVQANTEIHFKVDVDDWDRISGNDYLGSHERRLTIADCWGMRDGQPPGFYQRDATRKGGDAPSLGTLQFTYSVQDRTPPDPSAPFRQQYWWRSDNFKTPQLSKLQYANTFRDVEIQTNTLDAFMNPFDSAYYELAYKGVAKTGNCFGISLEAAYARSGESIFGQPIYRVQLNSSDSFNTTENNVYGLVQNQFNYRHAFQLGAAAIDWVLLKLLTPGALDPMAVFDRVQACLSRGDVPVISMVEPLEGRGHTMLPYRCIPAMRGTPAKILVADPNVVWREKADDPTWIEISGKKWKFVHGGESSDYGSNGEIAGLLPKTILLETPFHVLDSQPRTPFWEVLLALIGLTGGIFLVFGESETDGIKVGTRDFYRTVNGTRGIAADGAGGMVRVPMLDAGQVVPELYAQRGPIASSVTFDLRGTKAGKVQHLSALRAGAVQLTAKAAAGQTDQVKVEDGATPRPTFGISGSDAKQWQVTHSAPLDRAGRDRRAVRAEFDGKAAGTARVALTDRAETIEIEAPGSGPVTVEIASASNGTVKRANLTLQPQPGVKAYRLRPDWSSITSPATLENLSSIRGAVVSSATIAPD